MLGPDVTLSTTVTEPDNDPPPVGVSETENPHFAPAASSKPLVQGLVPDGVTPYSPDAVRLDNFTGTPLELVSWADPVLVDPIATLPKFIDPGENVRGLAGGPPVALPERLTDCGLKETPVAVSVTASPPLTSPPVPFVVGENVTLNVQLDAALSEFPHGLVPPPTAAKSPPATQEMFCAVAALFVIVTVIGALILPTVVWGNVRMVGETAMVTSPEPDS
jgi:hypothetical protein